jgi:hypothetical protein
MMTTKARLFGPDPKNIEESEGEDEDFELASGTDPVKLVRHLKQQLQGFKKAYTN